MPAFALGGWLGARLMLCLLITPILGWACWRWLDGRAPPGDIALAIAGVLLCPVVLFGSTQIYADLLSGVIIAGLAFWLWNGEGRDEAATSAPVTLGAPVGGRPMHGLSSASWPAFSPGCTSRISPPLCCSACSPSGRYGANGHGTTQKQPRLVGIRSAAAVLFWSAPYVPRVPDGDARPAASGQSYTLAGTPYLRAAEMLLGRHVDQSQGLFWHQPLFFPGLVALGWMIRRRHPLTLFWLCSMPP